MNKKMTGKIALVSGAAKGIGQAVAERLYHDGYSLLLMDIDDASLQQNVTAFQDTSRLAVYAGSVADSGACEEAVKLCVARFGGITTLSHNAGIQRYGSAEDTSVESWHEVMNVNLNSAFYLSREALPHLRQSRGNIVLMGSVQSLAAQDNAVAYVTSKHGLRGLTQSMALDFAKFGVRVNLVAPGSVDTPMLRHAVSLHPNPAALMAEINRMHPLGRSATAEEVANVVAFLCSDQASFVTGETLRVDGGLLSKIPGSPE